MALFRTIQNLLKSNRESVKLPKSVQQIIPIDRVWEDGIFLSGRIYSKTWRLMDINYAVASLEDKREIFLDYSALLALLDAGSMCKITIVNRRVNEGNFRERNLIRHAGDGLDEYRDEYNAMLMDKALRGGNSVEQDKYITISLPRKNIEEARSYFSRKGLEIGNHLAAMQSRATPLNANERLRIFHDYFRPGQESHYHFDIRDKRRRHSLLDYIAPDSYEYVSANSFKLGEKYNRCLFLRDYANYTKDSFITEICEINRPMVLSIDILPVPTNEAVNALVRQLDGINGEITSWQQSQNKNLNFAVEAPQQLTQRKNDTTELYTDMTERDQRCFCAFVSILHMADDKESLEADTESIIAVGNKHQSQIAPLTFRQLDGLQMALPFGPVTVSETSFRTLSTESLAVLTPFQAQQISDANGIYYGTNSISRNLIIADRGNLLNGNGMILGVSGSGKSFLSKKEIVSLILATNDDVLVTDPENEYSRLIQALGGEVIRIAADSRHHINAMELNENYSDADDPIALKSEFLMSLCELILGAGHMNAHDKSLIDRCAANVYAPYIKRKFAGQPPTLMDFYDEMLRQKEPQAKNIALALELFTKGSLNTFAKQTNVDTKNRVICYNIRDLGKQLKTIGMLIVLDSIFNRITRNREQGRRTWVIVDEIYLMFNNEYSGNYLYELWKRVRKYNGFCTGITQNIGDLLQSHTARAMLSNSEFLVMLNQSATDREELAKLLNISDTQLSYITNQQAGRGLLKCAGAIVPFEDDFPPGALYDLMTTAPRDLL